MRMRRLVLALVAAAALFLIPATVDAHYERPTHAPDGTGHVPVYRTTGPHLVVCKQDDADFANRIASFPADLQDYNRRLYSECLSSGYRDLQAAVDQVTQPGTTILVLPGVYLEEPSLVQEPASCNNLPARRVPAGYQILSYEQQKACPHLQNLVGIFGIKDLQIEGTGAAPSDVIFDAQFQKLNVIRGDRSDGLYLRNFTAQRSTFNAVYVIEADGFVIDRLVGRWNTEYGFLSFAVDHGLFKNCEAYGNGDSGVYPGGTSDINGSRGFDVPRYAVEVTGCHSHDNLLGYSGTGGDSNWVHDNEFDHNSAGASMDSLFPNHPGLPQNHALFEHNLIHSNNSNYYGYVRDGTCARPYLQRGIEKGVVCPSPPVPVGVGVIVAGGNYDMFRDNWVYDNWKVGFVQTWAPGVALGDNRLSAQEWTSSHNRYLGNHMGSAPDGSRLPNGLDYFWDGQGADNCWQIAGQDSVLPATLPSCPGGSPDRLLADPNKLVLFGVCISYDLGSRTLPAGCDWFDTPRRPGEPAATINIQFLFPLIQLLALVAAFAILVRRRVRHSRLGLAGAAIAVLGSVLLVAGSADQLFFLAPPGVALLGIGWIGASRLIASRKLATLSVVLGAVAVLEAIDSGLYLLPSPIGPVWIRVLLETVWIVWTVLSLIRPKGQRLRSVYQAAS
ncbi:MAG TPA: hypothetical protein VGV88_02765 [Candidatus Dormibacteraeota bacterium]|nr:hypothetical protein [Candidatus Dormibacteraeota bacterium]